MESLIDKDEKFICTILNLFDGILIIRNKKELMYFRFKNKLINLFFKNFIKTKKNLKNAFELLLKNRYFKLIEEILDRKESKIFELEIKIKGHKFIYDIFPTYLNNNNTILLFQNITKIEKSRINREHQDLQDFIDIIPYSMELRDPKGYFIMANTKFKEMWRGHPKYSHSLLTDHHTFEDKQAFLTAANGGLIKNFESRYNPHPADSDAIDKYYWVNIDMFPIFDKYGEVESVACMYQDITERKNAELEIKYLKEKLAQKVRDRTIKLENSERKYRIAYKRSKCFKSLFEHKISYIINQVDNSLNYIKNSLEENKNVGNIPKKVENIKNQLTQGKNIINNIRNLSEIEKTEIKLHPTDLLIHLRKAIEFTELNYRNKNLEINIIKNVEPLVVKANELLIDIFENVLSKIIESTPNEVFVLNISISSYSIEEIEYLKVFFYEPGVNDIRKIEKVPINDIYNKTIIDKGLDPRLSLVDKYLDLCEGEFIIKLSTSNHLYKNMGYLLLFKRIE